jgi:hypothetical protein
MLSQPLKSAKERTRSPKECGFVFSVRVAHCWNLRREDESANHDDALCN